MTPDERDLLLKARESISAAEVLLESGYPDFAASHAYYAMFYVGESFLEGDGLAGGIQAARGWIRGVI